MQFITDMSTPAQIKHAIASETADGTSFHILFGKFTEHGCHFKATEHHIGLFHTGGPWFKWRQNTRCSQRYFPSALHGNKYLEITFVPCSASRFVECYTRNSLACIARASTYCLLLDSVLSNKTHCQKLSRRVQKADVVFYLLFSGAGLLRAEVCFLCISDCLCRFIFFFKTG